MEKQRYAINPVYWATTYICNPNQHFPLNNRMELIFQYDIDRLKAYSTHKHNNISIIHGENYTSLSFPEVDYFNYVIQTQDKLLGKNDLQCIKAFYENNGISKHQIILSDTDTDSETQFNLNRNGYSFKKSFSQTFITPTTLIENQVSAEVSFIEVTNSNIDLFTSLYLKGFDAHGRDVRKVSANFNTLLNNSKFNLMLIKYGDIFVGINVLYHKKNESLLAGGAIIPEYRNKGLHKAGLNFRIQKALAQNSNKITAFAYDNTVSLQNMFKVRMVLMKRFNIYEYNK